MYNAFPCARSPGERKLYHLSQFLPVERERVERVTCTIPGRFHVGYSLLGRAIRRWVKDPVRAEAVYILALGCLATFLVMGFYAVGTISEVGPWAGTRDSNVTYQWILGGATAIVALSSLLGYQPPITVAADADSLSIDSLEQSETIAYTVIKDTTVVSISEYYEYYRFDPHTTPYVNRLAHPVLLLKVADRTIALGLDPADRKNLLNHIAKQQQTPTARLDPVS